MPKYRTWVKCGLADLQTGERVNCGPSLQTAYYPRALPVATARLPRGGLATLRALEFTLFMGPLPSLPPSLPSLPSTPVTALPPLYIPFLSLTLEVGSLNTARGLGSAVTGCRATHSVNQIRCILPLKCCCC